MRWNPFNTSVGLALGGGAAKGIAHIGVLKAFEEEEVEISYLSGTSIGSLVAAYYAFGKSIDDLIEAGKELNFNKITSFNWRTNGGLFTTKSVREMILRDLGDVQIEDARIPLAICTTDIVTGEQVVFEKGSLVDAVCASIAVPGLFVPAEINGRKLVDGGIVENVPISLLSELGAGIVVGIDLNSVHRYPQPKGMFDVIGNAIDICMDLKTKDQLKRADIVLSLDLSGFNRTDNRERLDELIDAGYQPAKAKIRRLLWFKRANSLRYVYQVLRELVPFKVPEFIRAFTREKIESVKIK